MMMGWFDFPPPIKSAPDTKEDQDQYCGGIVPSSHHRSHHHFVHFSSRTGILLPVDLEMLDIFPAECQTGGNTREGTTVWAARGLELFMVGGYHNGSRIGF